MNQLLLGFLFMVFASAGLFLLLKIPAAEYLNRWRDFFRKAHKAKRRRREILGSKKKSKLLRAVRESHTILTRYGKARWFPVIEMLALVFAAAGVFLSFALDNLFLIPVALGLGFLPFAFIVSQKKKLAANFNRNMKAALGVVTSAYIQNDDLIRAVKSNVKLMKAPFSQVFREFVAEATFLESNLPNVISSMQDKVDDPLFREWCGTLIECQDNKELKYVLPVVVDKIDELIGVQGELDTMMVAEERAFQTILVFNLSTMPLMYLIKRDWCELFMTSAVGKLIAAVFLCISLISVLYSVKVLKPVEYR